MNAGVVMLMLLLVVVTVLVGGGLYVKKMLVVTDPNVETGVDSDEATTAQEFLPFVDIDGNMIDLGNHRYRAIIECPSVNYNLKTETEREVIELSFQKFISSLSFPVTFHIQTRIVDNTVIVRELEKDVERIRVENPTVYNYAKTYLESMRNFDVYIGNVKQKKKYIIIGYEDAYVLGEMTDSEKKELSRQQIRDRVGFVIGQLSSMQIKAHCLDESELIELLYNSYQREDAQYDVSEMLGIGGYTSISVSGENKLSKMSVEQKIDMELLRVQNMIKEECLDAKLGYEPEVYREVSSIYNKIKSLRDEVGSPYESNYSMNIWGKENNGDDDKVTSSDVENSRESIYTDRVNSDLSNKENIETSRSVSSVEKEESVLSFEDDKEEDNWSLDFGDSLSVEKEESVLSFEDDKEEDNWSLDFGDSLSVEKEESVLSFEDDKEEDNWSLDFGDSLSVEKEESVLSLEDDKEEDNWSLDFGDSLSVEKEESVLSFEDDKEEDNWSLDFGDSLGVEKEEINKKSNRLKMFD